jgi:hypothetical protein
MSSAFRPPFSRPGNYFFIPQKGVIILRNRRRVSQPKARAPAPREPAIPSHATFIPVQKCPVKDLAGLSITTLFRILKNEKTPVKAKSEKKFLFFVQRTNALFRVKNANEAFPRPRLDK